MTKFELFQRSNTTIIVWWKKPAITPKQFAIYVRCKHLFNNGTYLKSEALLPANKMHFMLNDLVPETQCDFILKAVYNPASIDNGILATCKTLESSKTVLLSKLFIC